MKQFLVTILHQTARLLNLLAGIALLLMMLVVVYDILGRTFGWWFVLSTVGQTTLYMMILGFLGLASCFRDEGNIVVDIATQHLSAKSVRRIDAFWALIAAIVLLPLGYMALKDGFTLHGFGRRSEVLHISPLVHHSIAAFGLAIAALISMAECVKLIWFKEEQRAL
jgi:TRAP-type C4-dicarboxylate transport system permease small subunit